MHLSISRLCLRKTLTDRSPMHGATNVSVLKMCGEFGTPSWRLFFQLASTASLLSPWHDICRQPQGQISNSFHTASADATKCSNFLARPDLFMYVNEIPRGTRHKLEMRKEEKFNPIVHDLVTSSSGSYVRMLKYGDMPFNYGFVPQTWECPEVDKPNDKSHNYGITSVTHHGEEECRKYGGDGDPLDVVVLGPAISVGAVHVIRVLGVLGLIDDGELDWKIIAESVGDYAELLDRICMRHKYNATSLGPHKAIQWKNLSTCHAGDDDLMYNHTSVQYEKIDAVPSTLKSNILNWFENYKTADSKPRNTFIYDRQIRGLDDALHVIHHCAAMYDDLIANNNITYNYWLGKSRHEKSADD